MPESNRIQSTSNSNLTTKRKKHVNKLFDIKSLNTNNKLITKMFQYYDGNICICVFLVCMFKCFVVVLMFLYI
jgi:hypothetical protein